MNEMRNVIVVFEKSDPLKANELSYFLYLYNMLYCFFKDNSNLNDKNFDFLFFQEYKNRYRFLYKKEENDLFIEYISKHSPLKIEFKGKGNALLLALAILCGSDIKIQKEVITKEKKTKEIIEIKINKKLSEIIENFYMRGKN